jgi:hypothetical protein
LGVSDEFFTDHERLCGKLLDIESRIMSLNIASIRSDWGTRIARLKHRWIKFYEGQLKKLPDRFESYSDAQSIAEKLNILYSDMVKLDPAGADEWRAKNRKLANDLMKRRRFEWSPKIPSRNIVEGKLFFVNRDTAMTKFLEVIKNNREKLIGTDPGVGNVFQIALIDHLFGMGKTDFGHNFVYQCSRLKPTGNILKQHIDYISGMRTLYIVLKDRQLIEAMRGMDLTEDRKRLETALIDSIIGSLPLGPEFISYIRSDLDDLDPEKRRSSDLLELIIQRTGGNPLLVVLDEVGGAFRGPEDVIARRNLFIEFCKMILSNWLTTKDLHFLLLGRGDIFDYVGIRANNESGMPGSPVEFQRLPLSMIHRSKIKDIIMNTLRTRNQSIDGKEITEDVRLIDFYGLESNQIDEVVEAVVEQTNGHPRSIFKMLRKCDTHEDLLAYRDDFKVEATWLAALLPYSDSIKYLLDHLENGELNLTRPITEGKDKCLSKFHLADRACIRWEGDLESATLYATPEVRRALGILSYSFESFLSLYRPDRRVIYQKDRVFEYLLIKRLQTLFALPQSPAEKLSKWFKDTQFGSLDQFQVSPEILGFPKITCIRSSQDNPNLDDKTAHPDDLHKLMQMIRERGSGCYLPLPASSSSDGLIIYRNRKGRDSCTIIVGIAAKCVSSPVQTPSVENEISLFNRMYNEPVNDSQKRGLKNEKHFLLIVSTGGFAFAKQKGQPKKNTSDSAQHSTEYSFDKNEYPHVDSVLLIDLKSEEDRVEFFGIPQNSDLSKNLENIITH